MSILSDLLSTAALSDNLPRLVAFDGAEGERKPSDIQCRSCRLQRSAVQALSPVGLDTTSWSCGKGRRVQKAAKHLDAWEIS